MKYKILIISSYPPSRSGGLAQDNISALESEGHKVDFFTLYSFPGQKNNHYCITSEPFFEKLRRVMQRYPFLKKIRKIVRLFLKSPEEKTMSNIDNDGYRIPHFDERVPIIDNDTLFKHLPDNKYDFIIIYVIERMMTSTSFLSIYEKYKAPLFITCMDMIHFTGGCYFFGNCRRFENECGLCQILKSNDRNDQTHINYLTKKEVFSKIVFTTDYYSIFYR